MKGKRGWIRILEATVAVLIVSVTMIAVYSEQSVREDLSVGDYSYSLQRQILDDVIEDSDLRLDVLSVDVDLPGDVSYDRLDAFVGSKIPSSFGYLLRVCNLGDPTDFCKMDPIIFRMTMDKDVFVEDVVVGAELGGGFDAVYSPKKVRLFFWEGGFPEGFCRDECSGSYLTTVCSADFMSVVSKSCIDVDGCFEWSFSGEAPCGSGEVCVGGVCVVNSFSEFLCREKEIMHEGVAGNYDYIGECSAYDGGRKTGDIDCDLYDPCDEDDDMYECWNFNYATTSCGLSPDCVGEFGAGWEFESSSGCAAPCSDECSAGAPFLSCSGNSVVTKSCGDYDADSCLEYSSSSVLCGAGEICSGGACVGLVAELSMEISNVNYVWSSPQHYYYHDRVFVESGGVGVTLTWGEICFKSVGACNTATVNYKIEANSNLVLSNRDFYTSAASDIFNMTYTGIDDNGNLVSVSRVMSVSDSSWNFS